MIRHMLKLWSIVLLASGLMSCVTQEVFTDPIFTVTVYEDPNRMVRLQTMTDSNGGNAFSHPAYIDQEKLAEVMRGLQVEIHNAPLSIPFFGGSDASGRQRAFSDREIKFLAPLFSKGLEQATPEELVTFYENAEVSDQFELTTSGGVFVKGDEVHFLLSNFGVKTRIWQDNEQYEAPYHLRPMEPIDPQPGRLVFNPPHLMVEPKRRTLNIGLTAEPWQVGVLYKELK